MKHYKIENTISGADLGIYYSETQDEALDKMAREAGYTDYAEAESIVPSEEGEILVSPVTAYDVYEAAFDDAQSEYAEDTLDYIEQYADSAMNVTLSSAEAEAILKCRLALVSGVSGQDAFWHTVEKPLRAIEV